MSRPTDGIAKYPELGEPRKGLVRAVTHFFLLTVIVMRGKEG